MKSDKQNDLMMFAPENEKRVPLNSNKENDYWNVLVVDKEQEQHDLTHLALNEVVFLDKKFMIYDAYSLEEAKSVFATHPYLDLIVLDLELEADKEGLKLIEYIRKELK